MSFDTGKTGPVAPDPLGIGLKNPNAEINNDDKNPENQRKSRTQDSAALVAATNGLAIATVNYKAIGENINLPAPNYGNPMGNAQPAGQQTPVEGEQKPSGGVTMTVSGSKGKKKAVADKDAKETTGEKKAEKASSTDSGSAETAEAKDEKPLQIAGPTADEAMKQEIQDSYKGKLKEMAKGSEAGLLAAETLAKDAGYLESDPELARFFKGRWSQLSVTGKVW